MKSIRRSKNKIARLLTLVFFFNFSGLNNGIAYMMVSSEKIEAVNFAPALVKGIEMGLNPRILLNTLSDLKQMNFLFRAGGVVKVASQSAIQNMLVQSALTQVWFSCFVKKVYPVKDFVSNGIESSMDGSNELKSGFSAGVKVSGKKSITSQKKWSEFSERTLGYLNGGKMESWIIAKRFLLEGWKKHGGKTPFASLAHSRWRDRTYLVQSPRQMTGGQAPSQAQNLRRILYGAGESKDEPANICVGTEHCSVRTKISWKNIGPKYHRADFFMVMNFYEAYVPPFCKGSVGANLFALQLTGGQAHPYAN